MKTNAHHLLNRVILLTVLLSMVFVIKSSAQCTITSPATGGNPAYNITISINPVAVVPASNVCPWGYSYNVTYQYNISFSGAGTPDVNTLQLFSTCGSDNLFLSLPTGGGSGSLTTTTNPYRNDTNCNSATVSALGCTTAPPNVLINTSSGSINNQTISCPYAGSTPLPVKLVSFDARSNGDMVYLAWVTASEVQNDHFILQRSTDAMKWEALKKMDGTGNTSQPMKYDYVDQMPVRGMYYYRLQQVDENGSYAYSKIIGVRAVTLSGEITLYPNPGRNKLSISGLGKGDWECTFTGPTGLLAYAGPVSDGSINLPDMSAGVYYVSLHNKITGERKTMKYSKI